LNEAIVKRFILFFGLSLMPAVLGGCTVWSPATLFNNTGGAIQVNMRGNISTMPPNQSVEFRYPRANVNWAFRLAGGGCEYLYDVPVLPRKYGWPILLVSSDRKDRVQVEKDFSLNLLSPSYAGDTPASKEAFLQQEDFPLQPVSKKCR
jgi:hypothetical protein